MSNHLFSDSDYSAPELGQTSVLKITLLKLQALLTGSGPGGKAEKGKSELPRIWGTPAFLFVVFSDINYVLRLFPCGTDQKMFRYSPYSFKIRW